PTVSASAPTGFPAHKDPWAPRAENAACRPPRNARSGRARGPRREWAFPAPCVASNRPCPGAHRPGAARWLGPARSTPHLLAGVAPTRPDPPWAGARPGNRARWASRQAERPPCWPSRRRGWGACAQASARRIEALGARQTPGVLRIVTINLLGRGGRFLQVGVQGDAVVEDKAIALPFAPGVGQALEVVEDGAIELIARQAQLLHPGAGLLASDAARAVHGHAFAFGL